MVTGPTVFYLVWGSAGRYSDHRSWVASVQFSSEDANRVCEILNKEAQEYNAWVDGDYSRNSSDEGADRMAIMADAMFSWDDGDTSYSVYEASDDPGWSRHAGKREVDPAPAIECPRCHAASTIHCEVNGRVVRHDVRWTAANNAKVCIGRCARVVPHTFDGLYAPCGLTGCHNTLSEYEQSRNKEYTDHREAVAKEAARITELNEAVRMAKSRKAERKAAKRARRLAGLAGNSR